MGEIILISIMLPRRPLLNCLRSLPRATFSARSPAFAPLSFTRNVALSPLQSCAGTQSHKILTHSVRPCTTTTNEANANVSPVRATQQKSPQDEESVVIHQVEREPVPKVAAILGFSGLIPMAAGSYGAYFLSASQASLAIYYQMTYGVALMSFMGAVHWGLAMSQYSSVSEVLKKSTSTEQTPEGTQTVLKPTDAQQIGRYCLSVVPCLYGWGLQILSPDIALPALMVGFTAQFIADAYADRKCLVPTWYMKLRLPLTMGVLASLGVSYLMLGTNKSQ